MVSNPTLLPSIAPTKTRTIAFIIDQRTGEEFPAERILPGSDREIARLRLQVYDDRANQRPSLICAACHERVWPKYAPDRSGVTFSHFAGDSSDCPYNVNSPQNLALIDSMRYNGAKEGPDHQDVKELLLRSIKAASSDFDGLPRVERNWYGAKDPSKWRRPDVAATYCLKGRKIDIAFEIQLSATYLHVIAERRKFYLEDNALLFWVFKDASTDPRQYQDDLFYNNNSNLFVVNQTTSKMSISEQTLCLECHYLEPRLESGQLVESWRQRIVRFDELHLDLDQQRAYYYDYDREVERLQQKLQRAQKEEELAKIKAQYARIWLTYHEQGTEAAEEDYRRFVGKMKSLGIAVPDEITRAHSRFATLILSAERGHGVAIGKDWTLLQVANQAEKDYKSLFYYFYKVMVYFRQWERLFEQDDRVGEKKRGRGKPHESWRVRQQNIYQKLVSRDAEYIRDPTFIPLFQYLFPDIAVK